MSCVSVFLLYFIIILCRAEIWTLNTQQENKLLANEMDFWRSARKSRKEKARNGPKWPEMAPLERSWRWGRTF
jgi:hypothetical protein